MHADRTSSESPQPGPANDAGAPGDALSRKRPLAQMLRRFARNRLGMVGLVIMLSLLVAHLGAPLFTPSDPAQMNVREILQAPGGLHPFGTDQYGRDLFARVLYGGRISLMIGFLVAAITSVTGLLIGALAGYYPRLDGPLMRAMDILMSFPTLLTAMAIASILEPGVRNLIIAMVFPITPRTARIVRGSVLMLRERDFCTAARAVGAGDLRIILRHLLPNVLPQLLVNQTLVFGSAVLIEGGLSFLGIGVPMEVPTLGSTVAGGRPYLAAMPWFSMYPGLFIAMLVLGVNMLGDGLRDVLDPRMKS